MKITILFLCGDDFFMIFCRNSFIKCGIYAKKLFAFGVLLFVLCQNRRFCKCQ